MRVAVLLLAFVFALLPLLSAAADVHDIVLGPADVYQISATDLWRFEVLKEDAGRFADVAIRPVRGEAFDLTLFFITDTPDLARLDTPEKIASSVIAGAERYLPVSLEKKISLRPILARGRYGSLTLLTEADPATAPGGFKYHTRGMVRLSANAALGFSLLSREAKSSSYKQLLDYAYSFIKLPQRELATPSAKPMLTLERTLAPTPPTPATRGAQQDMRSCLNLPSDAEIARCASAAR